MSKHPIENPPTYAEAMASPQPQATGMYEQTFSGPAMSEVAGGSTIYQPIATAPPPVGIVMPPNMHQYSGPMPIGGSYPYPQGPVVGPPRIEPPKFMPTYGTMGGTHTTTVVTSEPPIIVVGGCPVCRIGVLEDDFTCCGIFCALFFFPVGILCCLAMRQKRCTNCRAEF